MGEGPGVQGSGLEARLDAMARSVGGSPDGAAFSASAGSVGRLGAGEGEAFFRAVAARRAVVIGAWGGGALGMIGVVAAIVVVVMGLRGGRVEEAPVARRMEEPTFWNLRAGVQEPGALDGVPGLGVPGFGGGVEEGAGVSPARWPGDLRP